MKIEYTAHRHITCNPSRIPLRSDLPEQCYASLGTTPEAVIIKKGTDGYFKTDILCQSTEEAKQLADEYNGKLGVTKAQAEAMKAGSMFGWDVPAADPKSYDVNGTLLRNTKDRGDAR